MVAYLYQNINNFDATHTTGYEVFRLDFEGLLLCCHGLLWLPRVQGICKVPTLDYFVFLQKS